MEYVDVVSCGRCGKFLKKNNTKHFCETVEEFNNSWKFLGGYDRKRSKGVWVD